MNCGSAPIRTLDEAFADLCDKLDLIPAESESERLPLERMVNTLEAEIEFRVSRVLAPYS